MNKIFNLKIDAIGLSLFRIFYSLVLFCELLQLYKFRDIIYDKNPLIDKGELDVSFIFYFWFVIIFMLVLGVFTRFSTILNYIFSVIIFSSASKFEYHVFYVYLGINFLMMFMPVARVLSIDNLLQKIKYSSIHKTFVIDRKVLQVNYWMLLFVGIGLVYIDSVFHKTSSKIWMNGLGVWLPSSLPMITWNNTSFLLNQEWIVKVLGYLVLIFEGVFVFLFWFKKWRIPLFVIGVFFHVGILITYPIPYFALTYIVIYLLLIPVSFWRKIGGKLKLKKEIYTFYYDAECPLCNKVVIIIKHFDIFSSIKCQTVQGNYSNNKALQNFDEEALLINIHGVKTNGKVVVGYWAYIELLKSLLYTYPLGLLGSLPGISFLGKKIYAYIAGNRLTERCTSENCFIPTYNEPINESQATYIKNLNQLSITKFFWKAIIIVMIFGQALFIWFSPTIQHHFPKVSKINKIVNIPYGKSKWFFQKYLGISHHAVFLDEHFIGFNHIFKIIYIGDNSRKLVPIFDNNGMPGEYLSGSTWCNVSFNVITTIIEKNKIQNGIVPYLRYYINDNNLKNGDFEFYVKEIEIPNQWGKDFLNKQIAKPWVKVGNCKITNDTTAFNWNDKMQKILIKESSEN